MRIRRASIVFLATVAVSTPFLWDVLSSWRSQAQFIVVADTPAAAENLSEITENLSLLVTTENFSRIVLDEYSESLGAFNGDARRLSGTLVSQSAAGSIIVISATEDDSFTSEQIVRAAGNMLISSAGDYYEGAGVLVKLFDAPRTEQGVPNVLVLLAAVFAVGIVISALSEFLAAVFSRILSKGVFAPNLLSSKDGESVSGKRWWEYGAQAQKEVERRKYEAVPKIPPNRRAEQIEEVIISREKKSFAPGNLPIASEEISEIAEEQSVEDSESEGEDLKGEPTAEDLKRRLNQLLNEK